MDDADSKIDLNFLGTAVKRLKSDLRIVREDVFDVRSRLDTVELKIDLVRSEMDAGFNTLLTAIEKLRDA